MPTLPLVYKLPLTSNLSQTSTLLVKPSADLFPTIIKVLYCPVSFEISEPFVASGYAVQPSVNFIILFVSELPKNTLPRTSNFAPGLVVPMPTLPETVKSLPKLKVPSFVWAVTDVSINSVESLLSNLSAFKL